MVTVVEGDVVGNEDERQSISYHHEDFPEVPETETKT